MRLIDHKTVLSDFTERVAAATAVDVASAWVSSGKQLEILRDAARNRNVKIRVVTGLAGNATHPNALRALLDFAELRIVEGNRLFHPKFYLFHTGVATKTWIGSANFTSGGFQRNAELLAEMDGGREAAQWFDGLWDTLPKDARKAVDAYEARYEPPQYTSRNNAHDAPDNMPDIDHPYDLLTPMPPDWSAYMRALRSADSWWDENSTHFSVLAEERSYIHTIESAGTIIRKSSWDDLSRGEVNVLLSFHNEDDGAWGLLGHMGAAGQVKNVFLEATPNNLKIREVCRKAVIAAAEAPEGEEFYAAIRDAMATITAFRRFGPGIATRLLTLACPARAVSVNSASASGLGRLFDLPETVSSLGSPNNYVELLRGVHATKWYRAPEPTDGFERQVWSMRAALLDAFVYGAPE